MHVCVTLVPWQVMKLDLFLPKGTQFWEKTQAITSSGACLPGSWWSRRGSANVCGQSNTKVDLCRVTSIILGQFFRFPPGWCKWQVCVSECQSHLEHEMCFFLNSKRTICIQEAVLFFFSAYFRLLLLISAVWHTDHKHCLFSVIHSPHQ